MMQRLTGWTLGGLLWVLSGVAFAHGGGLDGYGCHHNRKAGGYHCHRGPLAGQAFASKEDMLKALEKKGKTPAPYGESKQEGARR